MFNNELTIKAPSKGHCPTSTVPNAKNHLLQQPPTGGRPITLSAPTENAANVHGIRRPSPSSSLTRVLCAPIRIAPAQKKSVILPKACMTMCMPLPITPDSVANATPNTM